MRGPPRFCQSEIAPSYGPLRPSAVPEPVPLRSLSLSKGIPQSVLEEAVRSREKDHARPLMV